MKAVDQNSICLTSTFVFCFLFFAFCYRVMFWSDWGSPAKIERANMDGSDRKTVITGNGVGWPNGLAIDYKAGRLYWTDAKTDRIERSDLDGNQRKVIQKGQLHPFGLDVFGGFIYWTDWVSKDLKRVNKTNLSSVSVLRSNLDGLNEIRVFAPGRQGGE